MVDMKEFVAFARLLLRRLKYLQALLDEGKIEEAKVIVQEMIDDCEADTQA